MTASDVGGLARVTWRARPVGMAGVAASAMVPAAVTWVRGGSDFTTALALAGIVAGAAFGFACDDPAAPTLAPSPVPLAARRVLRLALVAACAGVSFAACMGLSALASSAPLHVADRLGALAMVAGPALGWAARAGQDAPVAQGPPIAMGTALAALVSAALEGRWPRFPNVFTLTHPALMWAIGAAGFAAAAWWSRDPAGRRPLLRSAGWPRKPSPESSSRLPAGS